MIGLVDRKSALQDFLETHVLQRWQYEFVEIDKRYKENQEILENDLISSFDLLCEKVTELQNQNLKGSIKYIYISFLRTSIMENTSSYRIDAYDENWFLDKEECFTTWDPHFIFSSLFSHMEELEEKRVEYMRKITPMDIDKIKFLEALKYNKLAEEFVRSVMSQIIEIQSYKQMSKTEDISIIFGEYKDRGEIL